MHVLFSEFFEFFNILNVFLKKGANAHVVFTHSLLSLFLWTHGGDRVLSSWRVRACEVEASLSSTWRVLVWLTLVITRNMINLCIELHATASRKTR